MRAASIPSSASFVDRYMVERELGHGGMATVYLAEERKHERKVAIKVLRPEVASSLGAERFLREIGIAARLAHPYIVPLIDSGESDGLLYYVTPYVPDGTLRDRLRRDGPLPIADTLRIATEVGAALDYAHRHGFVHRDVKPENILFADGHAVLADFGIARACSGSEDQAITDAGFALGTPEYMSPEQASGDRDLAASSDIYSLACVIYEMLTSEPPLRGRNARSTMAKQVTELPRPVRVLRPDVPAGVERAVGQALAKDPDARFAGVTDFLTSLRAGADTGRPSPRTATRSVAVLPFVNAGADPATEYLSDGITDELIAALAKVEGLRVASRTSVFALKGKPLDVRAIGALLGASAVLEGSMRSAGNRLRITAQLTSADDGQLIWSQRYDRTIEDVFAVQDEIASTIVNTLRASWLADLAEPLPRRYTESVTAYELYLKGRYAWNLRTQEGVGAAIALFEQAIAEDPRYALAYTGLADAYALHIDYRSVAVHEGFARAKLYARQALALDETLAEAHASLAWSLFIYDWDWDGAGRESRRAIELNPRYATAHQWYGFLLTIQGRSDEALVEAHTAQELDPASVSVRRSLALQYLYSRQYERARYHLGRAIEMNPTAEETYRILGLTLTLAGQHAEAERVLRGAVAMPAAGTLSVATLGLALARGGHHEEARALRSRLEAQARTGYVSPVAFAMLAIGLDELELALEWAERSVDDRRGWLVYSGVNPVFDPLRGRPRFEALRARLSV